MPISVIRSSRNFFMIPNDFIDEHLKNLSMDEIYVATFIFRYPEGVEEDILLKKIPNLTKPRLDAALKKLIDKGIV